MHFMYFIVVGTEDFWFCRTEDKLRPELAEVNEHKYWKLDCHCGTSNRKQEINLNHAAIDWKEKTCEFTTFHIGFSMCEKVRKCVKLFSQLKNMWIRNFSRWFLNVWKGEKSCEFTCENIFTHFLNFDHTFLFTVNSQWIHSEEKSCENIFSLWC